MAKLFSSLKLPGHTPGLSDAPSHTEGTNKGEEWVIRKGREPGRNESAPIRDARDSTSINAYARQPIDPRMPQIPPS